MWRLPTHVAVALILALSSPAFPVSAQEGAGEGAGESAEGEGEHRDGDGDEGEEGGVAILPDALWDATRRGARLVLRFNPATSAFVGTVENTTLETLCAVRVEVHLSSGIELGPTERTNLPPRAMTDVRLLDGGEVFDAWTAHPETSGCGG